MPTGLVNLKQWNAAIGLWSAKKIPAETEKVQRAAALDLLARTVQRTPVDTGRARGNWQLTANRTTDAVLDKLDPTGVALDVSELQRTTPFGFVAIQNALPYIQRLEEGWSRQAPAGMLSLSLTEVAAAFKLTRTS